MQHVADVGEEVGRRISADVERIWQTIEDLYGTGLHPAVQVAIRHRGELVLNRALGIARSGLKGAVPCTVDTPFVLFSATKPLTALVVHLLEQDRLLLLDDPVAEYLPEFSRHGKGRITLRHLLSHRAGIPDMPPEVMEGDVLSNPSLVVPLLAELKPRHEAGRLAYHALTAGPLLGEVIRRATGRSLRHHVQERISRPLGLERLSIGVPARRSGSLAESSCTGMRPPRWVDRILHRALGATLVRTVDISNSRAFHAGIVPSLNGVSTAADYTAFLDCLRSGGRRGRARILPRIVVHRALAPEGGWEWDRTVLIPMRYSCGFVLGGGGIGLFGFKNPRAFGHLGLTNILVWSDPDRELSVALLTSGKPLLDPGVRHVPRFVFQISMQFGR